MLLNRPVDFTLNLLKQSVSILYLQKGKINELFKALQGNAKVLLITEPFFSIPMLWCATYIPLYMAALGLSKMQIGWITSIALVPQIIGLILGGYLADIWGRKKVVMFFDIICWITPFIILLISQNIWDVLIAVCIWNFSWIVAPGWSCLFIENTEIEKRPLLFSMFQIFIMGCGLFLPIAGIIIKAFGILDGCRILFGITILSTSFALIIRQKNLVETKAEVSNVNLQNNFIKEYIPIIKKIFTNKDLMFFLIIQVLSWFTAIAWSTYSPIYITDEKGIGIDKSSVSIVPFVFSGVLISLMLLMPPFDMGKKLKNRLLQGVRLSVLASIIFLISPSQTMVFLVISTFISALGVALFRPVFDAYGANIMKDSERAKISAVILVLSTLFSIPSAPIAGKLYEIDPKLPFLFILGLQFATILFIQSKIKKIEL
ncbi:MAG: MFS transporter [Candidatus Firestonebacteria bacterium]